MKLDPRALPSTDDIQRTLFQTFQEKRKTIITVGVLVVLGAVALVYYVVTSESESSRLRSDVFDATRTRSFAQAVMNLEELLRGDVSGSEVEPYALLKFAQVCYAASQEDDLPSDEAIVYLDKGVDALDRLDLEFPEDFWTLQPSPSDPNVTLVRHLRRKMKADRKWLVDHTYAHPEVNRDLTALVELKFGSVRIGFFPDLAPDHVANFVKLAKEGFFNDLLVHRVVPKFVIQTGDPNTKNRDNMHAHGKGGPGYTQKPEKARFFVNHLRGVVSAAKGPEGESGSQFFICLADRPDLDKGYTPFGEVVDGMDVVDLVGAVQTFGQSAAYRGSERLRGLGDHPVQDVIVRSVSIWKGDEIDEGHTWDTSIVGTEWKDAVLVDDGEKEGDESDPELEKKLEALMGDVARLEEEGSLEDALAKALEVLELDPTHEAALAKAAELREKIGR